LSHKCADRSHRGAMSCLRKSEFAKSRGGLFKVAILTFVNIAKRALQVQNSQSNRLDQKTNVTSP